MLVMVRAKTWWKDVETWAQESRTNNKTTTQKNSKINATQRTLDGGDFNSPHIHTHTARYSRSRSVQHFLSLLRCVFHQAPAEGLRRVFKAQVTAVLKQMQRVERHITQCVHPSQQKRRCTHRRTAHTHRHRRKRTKIVTRWMHVVFGRNVIRCEERQTATHVTTDMHTHTHTGTHLGRNSGNQSRHRHDGASHTARCISSPLFVSPSLSRCTFSCQFLRHSTLHDGGGGRDG